MNKHTQEMKLTRQIVRWLLYLVLAALLGTTISVYAQEGTTGEGDGTAVPGFEPPVATMSAPSTTAEPMFLPDGSMVAVPPPSADFPAGSLIVDPSGTVDTGEPCPNPVTSVTYNDIQAAINCAADGGTVGVNAGTYIEALTISKDLTLLGASAKTVTVDANDTARVVTINEPVTVNIADITLTDGQGGITTTAATLTLTRVHVSANFTGDNGGGIKSDAGTVNLIASTISGSDGLNGGSIYSNAGTINVVNSTISGGHGQGTGGGIFTNAGTVNLINATLIGNSRPQVYKGLATVNVSNTVIANGATSSTSTECNVALTSAGHNISSDNSCGLTAAGDKPNTNPLLGALADNGGTTLTHLPAANSPALDAGDNAICAAAPVNGIDQRGTVRPQNGVCDIGAVEVGANYGANLIENGTFDAPIGSADSNWGVFINPPAQFVNQITGGVFEFYTTGAGGAVLQRTGDAVPANTGMEVTFDLGNSSANRKRVTVIAWDSSFADLRVCTFWLPGNTALRAYRMQFRTTLAWTNAQLHFYAATGDSLGYYRLDNVVMRTDSSVTEDVTRCYDPGTPAPGVGADSANFVVNGDFGGGTYPVAGVPFPNNWGLFTAPATVESDNLLNAAWQVSGGVFEYYRKARGDLPAGTANSAVILQNTTGSVPQNGVLEATFQLGNSGATRARITVLLHRADFGDLQVCSFWLEPGAALGTYTMRTYTTMPWSASGQFATISFYSATAHSAGWLRIDNVSVKSRPTLDIDGTTCYTPGSTVAHDGIEATAEPIIAPTLEPTATYYAAPAVQEEQPLIATPTATVAPQTDEGTSGE